MPEDPQSEQPDGAPVPTNQADTEQPHEAATTPQTDNSEHPHEAATTPEAGKQAVRQSSPTTVTSKQQRRGRRRRKRKKKKGPLGKVLGAIGALIGTLVGFFLGVASSQVSDYVKRSDKCIDALEAYAVGVNANFTNVVDVMHDPKATDPQRIAAGTNYINLIDTPRYKIQATCPVDLEQSTEYLDKNRIKDFESNYDRMTYCVEPAGCRPNDDENSVAWAAANSAEALLKQAEVVPNWGLWRRAKYVVTHWK